jgi:hypothetical protein
MSIEETFGNYFKPEVKSSGRKLFAQEKVSLSARSETNIQAYVRVAPPFKVTFAAADVSSNEFVANCSCPVAKKSRFCKHIWATLLCTEESYPDFLIGKTEINKNEVGDANDVTRNSVSPAAATPSPAAVAAADARKNYQETAKQRANDYRKEQYQKQKTKAKEKKRAQSGRENFSSLRSLTPEIEAALAYFSENGFPMPEGPSREILTEAKRTLSRVFHPDKGGTHAETVELNQNCEVLLQFLG